jgi:hypothetical protein
MKGQAARAASTARFQELCALAGIKPRTNVENGVEEPWKLKDLRKTCAPRPGVASEISERRRPGVSFAIGPR